MFQTDCNVSHLLFEKLLKQKKQKKQTIHGLKLGNVMLGKEQGSSKQTNKQKDRSLKQIILRCHKIIAILNIITIH